MTLLLVDTEMGIGSCSLISLRPFSYLRLVVAEQRLGFVPSIIQTKSNQWLGVRFTSVKWIPCVPHLRCFPAFSPSHQGSMERRKETTRSREMRFTSNGMSFPPERHVKRRPFVMTLHSWCLTAASSVPVVFTNTPASVSTHLLTQTFVSSVVDPNK